MLALESPKISSKIDMAALLRDPTIDCVEVEDFLRGQSE